jgi:hypothetical protein
MFTLKTGVFKSALCLLTRQTNCRYRKEIWPKHVVGNKKGSYRVCGPGSSVGIATGYRLDGPGIESPRFYAPVETGHGAYTASCTMGTGSFPGVECGRGVTLTHHPF